MLNELLIILVLILVNGLLAGAEIAIVTIRKSRLRELVAQGSRSARAIERLRELPERFLATVLVVVSFLSLILGELVPKSLAIRNGERYALLAARPLAALAVVAAPVVWFLTATSNLVLRAFGDRTNFTEARLSMDELRGL